MSSMDISVLVSMVCIAASFFASPRGTTRKLFRKSHRRWRSILRPRLLLGLLSFYVGLFFICFAAAVYLSRWVPESPMSRDVASGETTLVEVAILTCLFAPVLEELLYRGYLLRVARWIPRRTALLVACGLFGLGHPDALLQMFVGFFLTFLYFATGSLRVPIVAHALRNLIALAVRYLYGFAPVAAAGVVPRDETLGSVLMNAAQGCILVALGWKATARTIRYVLHHRLWREIDGSAGVVPHVDTTSGADDLSLHLPAEEEPALVGAGAAPDRPLSA